MHEYLKDAMNSRLFQDGQPFKGSLAPGAADSRVVIVAGPNASGKSLLVRLLASWLNDDKVEPIQVSMRYRTAAGMQRVFMYGSDEDQSTGATSLHAVQGALRTSRGRTADHWIMLDEPDVGLSDDYAAAMGAYLAQYGNDLPEKARGFLVVTHSRSLVAGLLGDLDRSPHFIHLGAPQSLEDWLNNPRAPRTVEDLLDLERLGTERWRQVEDRLKKKA